jgi:hypothetical protein
MDIASRAREGAASMTDRGDPFHSVARELLCVLADAHRPMSLRDLQGCGRIDRDEAARQLSVARVAGFVRSVPTPGSPLEPSYHPTTLGWMIARRRPSRALGAARELRSAAAAPARDSWAA